MPIFYVDVHYDTVKSYLAVNPGALSLYAMNWLLGWCCEVAP